MLSKKSSYNSEYYISIFIEKFEEFIRKIDSKLSEFITKTYNNYEYQFIIQTDIINANLVFINNSPQFAIFNENKKQMDFVKFQALDRNSYEILPIIKLE